MRRCRSLSQTSAFSWSQGGKGSHNVEWCTFEPHADTDARVRARSPRRPAVDFVIENAMRAIEGFCRILTLRP